MIVQTHAAEIRFEELVALNHDMNPDSLVEGQTILLPGGKLSSRDREILAGIGPATYRTYPVREGEVLQDIMEKRNITRTEMEALNPGINLDKLSSEWQIGSKSCWPQQQWRSHCRMHGSVVDSVLKGIVVLAADQVLKLPAGKYTVREREMMTGSGVLPTEFFHVGSALGKTVLIGMICAAVTVLADFSACIEHACRNDNTVGDCSFGSGSHILCLPVASKAGAR